MARLPGLLKRTSKAEELALEEARQGSVARLERLLAQRAGVAMADDSVDDPAEDELEAVDGAPAATAVLVLGPGASQGSAAGLESLPDSRDAATEASPEPSSVGVPVMDASAVDATRRLARHRSPSAVIVEDDWDGDSGPTVAGRAGEAAPEAALAGDDTPPAAEAVRAPMEAGSQEPATMPVALTEMLEPAPLAQEPAPTAQEAAPVSAVPATPAAVRAAPRRAAAAREAGESSAARTVGQRRVVPPPPPRAGAKAAPAHPSRPKRRPRQPVVLAACPSCAVLLDPRPTTSKRCARCRERIVVKRVEGGVLYLTASAAAALEEAQRTVKVWVRLARARDRWLIAAEGVGAPSQRIERVARPMPSEEQVEAARDLYFAMANRSFATARRERRFADAAAIRRAHAVALHRDLGSPSPAPEAVTVLQRDALAAELRALRETGPDAELATTCCEACRTDAGLIVRISEELRADRLPHATCEAGLCRCRWTPTRAAGRRRAVARGSAG